MEWLFKTCPHPVVGWRDLGEARKASIRRTFSSQPNLSVIVFMICNMVSSLVVSRGSLSDQSRPGSQSILKISHAEMILKIQLI